MKIGEISKLDKSDYLPISKLDLKVLVKEIKSTLNNFFNVSEKNYNFKIALTGINSMHPNLSKILSECIKLPVYQFAPKSNLLLGDVNYISEDFYDITFARLFGLGIGLLSNSEVKKNKTLTDSALVNFAEPETKNIIIKNNLNNNQTEISNKRLSRGVGNDDLSLLKKDYENSYKSKIKNNDNEIKEKSNEIDFNKISKSKKRESDLEDKFNNINSRDLDPSKNDNLKNLKDNEESKLDSDLKNIKNTNYDPNKKSNEKKRFKMDTEFLDID